MLCQINYYHTIHTPFFSSISITILLILFYSPLCYLPYPYRPPSLSLSFSPAFPPSLLSPSYPPSLSLPASLPFYASPSLPPSLPPSLHLSLSLSYFSPSLTLPPSFSSSLPFFLLLSSYTFLP